MSPLAVGIPETVWLFYCASDGIARPFHGMKGKPIRIEPGANYHATFISPRDGHEVDAGPVEPDADGTWQMPKRPSRDDWVLVLADAKRLASL
jgi:hypothetical protein